MLAIERFLGGDMNHAGGRRSAVPMLFVRRDPHDVAGFDLAHFAAPALHPARSRNHEQRLSERMRMPGGAGAGLEAHQARAHARRRRRLDDRLLPYGASEAVGGRAAGWPRTAIIDIHDVVFPFALARGNAPPFNGSKLTYDFRPFDFHDSLNSRSTARYGE